MVREEIQPCVQGFLQAGKAVDLHAGCFFQPRDIFGIIRFFQVHGLVRAPGRQHRHREGFVRRQLFMPLQAVHRIIRCADGLHIAHHNEPAGGIALFLQLRVGQFPDFPGCLPVQDAFITEEPAKLQVAPVIQGIADSLSQHLRVLFKLFPVRGIAGDILFRHPCGPHQAPFIVVSAQPHLGDVFIPDILPDFLRAQMAVIIDDRHSLRRFMIKLFRRFRIQQKIPVQKRFHVNPFPLTLTQFIIMNCEL